MTQTERVVEAINRFEQRAAFFRLKADQWQSPDKAVGFAKAETYDECAFILRDVLEDRA